MQSQGSQGEYPQDEHGLPVDGLDGCGVLCCAGYGACSWCDTNVDRQHVIGLAGAITQHHLVHLHTHTTHTAGFMQHHPVSCRDAFRSSHELAKAYPENSMTRGLKGMISCAKALSP